MLKFLKVLMGMPNKSAIVKKFWQLSYIVAPKLLIKKIKKTTLMFWWLSLLFIVLNILFYYIGYIVLLCFLYYVNVLNAKIKLLMFGVL